MNGMLRPLRIYVCGPLSAKPGEEGDPAEIREANARLADQVGRDLFILGHFPFVPHTLALWWFLDERPEFHSYDLIVGRHDIMGWLSVCDAIFTLGGWEDSKGSRMEVAWAREHGLMEFSHVDEVPDVRHIQPGVFTKYLHHGKTVWVRSDLVGKHRTACLCHSCKKFFPDDRARNCSIANDIFANCVKYNLVRPVWECPYFEERDGASEDHMDDGT